eukprot:999292-Prymnesium_polylepis.1
MIWWSSDCFSPSRRSLSPLCQSSRRSLSARALYSSQRSYSCERVSKLVCVRVAASAGFLALVMMEASVLLVASALHDAQVVLSLS